MGSSKDTKTSDTDTPAPEAPEEVIPRGWKDARAAVRVRSQYDPAEIARRYLDDMETGGRLHFQNRKGPKKG